MFTLQAKIEELTRERENLTKENDVVRNEVHSGTFRTSHQCVKIMHQIMAVSS